MVVVCNNVRPIGASSSIYQRSIYAAASVIIKADPSAHPIKVPSMEEWQLPRSCDFIAKKRDVIDPDTTTRRSLR